jgi:polyphosphate kinase
VRRYCHVGTGNYNPQTARLYEDLGLFSCEEELGADVTDLFNNLTGYSRQRDYRRLLVAPRTLRPGLLSLIAGQAHPRGRIVLKSNHVVDPEMIEALYAASTSGAQIDLIVRSTCSVRPGVPGMSEHIRVRSLVGRFLEHSRIYHFGTGAKAQWYIGSADIMARNLDDRVEAAAPIREPRLRARLEAIIDVLLADDQLAWELDSEGTWHRVTGSAGVNAQEVLAELARGTEEHALQVARKMLAHSRT